MTAKLTDGILIYCFAADHPDGSLRFTDWCGQPETRLRILSLEYSRWCWWFDLVMPNLNVIDLDSYVEERFMEIAGWPTTPK